MPGLSFSRTGPVAGTNEIIAEIAYYVNVYRRMEPA